jgi:hypothetical protein
MIKKKRPSENQKIHFPSEIGWSKRFMVPEGAPQELLNEWSSQLKVSTIWIYIGICCALSLVTDPNPHRLELLCAIHTLPQTCTALILFLPFIIRTE